ncbi:YdjY domain-containing protein [Stieleria sp. TO1_6]|uniref:YdjY domain-containing protein n=1 Tax=Stieleria tagensis TaxID=2956795 RepID=UPI00209BB3EE|nr:YdjY domain-containing protein [Stieleria tagensis]MCO8122688.1 YdjY domain-containing protein [Stieleria tagensis]
MKYRSPLVSFVLCVPICIALAGCGRGTTQTAVDNSTEVAGDSTAGEAPHAKQVDGTPPAASSDPVDPPADSGPDASAAPSGRPLPPVPELGAADPPTETEPTQMNAAADTAVDPPAGTPAETDTEDLSAWESDQPDPEQLARDAFEPPPQSKPLTKQGRLWVDREQHRVYLDGYVALKRGPLEMFACPVGTKEHESIVAALAKSSEVHAALLAIEATPGTPVRFRPEFLPPTGQVIRVWTCWYDAAGEFHAVDARQWIQDLETEKAMAVEWVFAGSGFWQDPEDKREYYLADSGDMICVSNFSSAMLDVAMPSSADADLLRFVPFESKIPDRFTPVRLVLVPVPFPTDAADPPKNPKWSQPPTAKDVPRRPPPASS